MAFNSLIFAQLDHDGDHKTVEISIFKS